MRRRRQSGRAGRAAARRAGRGSARPGCRLQRQARRSSPRKPHGQGFIAATRTKRAGKTAVRAARAMLTRPSSSGCRSTSSTRRSNSGISSRNSTPLWASDISPGRGIAPPPTSATLETVWCGARNGRSTSNPAPAAIAPATEWIAVHSSDSSNESGGNIVRQPPRQHRLAGTGRPGQQQVVAAGGCDFQCPARQQLAAHVCQVALRRVCWWTGCGGDGGAAPPDPGRSAPSRLQAASGRCRPRALRRHTLLARSAAAATGGEGQGGARQWQSAARRECR